MNSPDKKHKITTFAERLLTEEAQAERRHAMETDKAFAAHYQKAFENPDADFMMNEKPGDDLPEEDAYWDEQN